MGDTVRRYGADPRRKLRREDRLVGPALLARKHGIPFTHLSCAIAAALHFGQSGDASASFVRQQVETLGVRQAVRELYELSDDEQDLVMDIVRAYGRLSLEDGRNRRA